MCASATTKPQYNQLAPGQTVADNCTPRFACDVFNIKRGHPYSIGPLTPHSSCKMHMTLKAMISPALAPTHGQYFSLVERRFFHSAEKEFTHKPQKTTWDAHPHRCNLRRVGPRVSLDGIHIGIPCPPCVQRTQSTQLIWARGPVVAGHGH